MIATTGIKFSSTKLIKDPAFNVDNIAQYHLFLNLSDKSLEMGILDVSSYKAVYAELFELSDVYNEFDLITALKELYEKHFVLQAGFWKSVKVSLNSKKFSLVPNTFFNSTFAKDYLSSTSFVDEERDKLKFYKHVQNDVVTVFSTPKALINFFTDVYPKVSTEYYHRFTALLESFYKNNLSNKSQALFCDLSKSTISIAAVHSGKFLAFNQFETQSNEDLLYYLANVAEKVGFEQGKSEVVITGDTDAYKAFDELLSTYFNKVSKVPRLSRIKFGYKFDEMSDALLFNTFSQVNCGY